MALASSLKISRQKLEFFYSLFLIVLIPGLLILNTVLITSSIRDDYDTELRRKADLANTVFGTLAAPNLDDAQQLQQVAENVQRAADSVTNISILKIDEGDFNVVATTAENSERLTNDFQADVARSRNESVAALVQNEADTSGRSWRVTTPIQNDNGDVAGIAIMNVSLADSDQLLSSTFQQALLVLVVTVVIAILLLLNHFKFVQYAVLFRKLKEVDQMKTDFLSVATHELRSPMTVIRGAIDNVIDGVFGDIPQDAKESLEQATMQTDRLSSLVSDLLNVSRIEQGKISYNIQPVNPREVIDLVVRQYKPNAEQKGLELVYKEPSEPHTINVDKSRLQEIITNLVDNAIKYSESGSVTVSETVEKDVLEIKVRDTGIGMSAEERERLFSRFYRVKNEQTASISGTGLGLWIIKQYIEQMGGQISVDSLKGEGTEFSVRFPLKV